MRAVAVIGANFGDEGKGLMTDYLSSPDSLVVRFNGGAQAGHTVVTPDGRRHVFHHFGSGTFAGAATFLSQFFIVNPLLWQKERDELGFTPRAFVHWHAPLTTPYDMLINQEVERSRGACRHGSCGIGINETIERCRGPHQTRMHYKPALLRRRLLEIRSEYVPQRLRELGLAFSEEAHELLWSDVLLENYMAAYKSLRASSETCDEDAIRGFEHVVFEGSQGLLLDEQHHFFPHVTRSRTGLHNVLRIAAAIGLSELDAVYVTRSYMTRHGNGPFPTEDKALLFADATNVHNDWQGQLRFGHLDIDLLADSIRADWSGTGEVWVLPTLAMTHLDQLGSERFAEQVAERCGIRLGYTSNGPTREHVHETDESAKYVQWLEQAHP